jgi:hypothetical protein
MAAGFRSPFFRWVGGLSAGGGVGPLPPIPPVLCTCPEYKHDPTTGCTFTFDGTLSNGFKLDGSLSNQFKLNETLSNQFSGEQTLSNQWGRRNCNG